MSLGEIIEGFFTFLHVYFPRLMVSMTFAGAGAFVSFMFVSGWFAKILTVIAILFIGLVVGLILEYRYRRKNR